jgi:sterol 3beta-glucosyltransferase
LCSFNGEINSWRVRKLGLPYLYGLAQSSTNLVTAAKLPFSAMWSASFVPKPKDWPDQCQVVGAFFVEQKTNFDAKPFEEFTMWLNNGPKPIFIGFGSMVIKEPQKLEKIIKEAARKANVRVVVQSGWSKLDVEDESGLCHNVGPCPHDWLLPLCCAVIHHGGAGTTAAGLRLGLPTFVCPFFGDQFMWGWFVSLAGVGPAPCPITKLTIEILAQKLVELASQELQKSAKELAKDMAQEDGILGGRNHFIDCLPVDNMLCDVSLLLGEVQMARYRLVGSGSSSGLRRYGIKVSSEVAGT